MTEQTVFSVMKDNLTSASSSFEISATTSSTHSSNSPLSTFTEFDAIALAVSTIGIIANGFLTLIMIKSNRATASTTSVLIGNQCLIDMFYSVNVFICYLRGAAGLKQYQKPPTVSDIIMCKLVDSGTISMVCANCSTSGLVAITLERYFKVVHPIGHRKYYRTWMTRVIIAATWLIGMFTYGLWAAITTKISDGFCYITAEWPNVTVQQVGME